MTADIPDWLRLKKALTVEAEGGFVNLQGKQQLFSEFLRLSLGQAPPEKISASDRLRLQELAREYVRYPEMSLAQRQHLVAGTRRFLQGLKLALEAHSQPSSQPPSPNLPSKVAQSQPLSLDLSLGRLASVGDKSAQLLQRLGLKTLRDVLFYYPRD